MAWVNDLSLPEINVSEIKRSGYSVKYSTILNPIRLKSEDVLPNLAEPLSEDSGKRSTQNQSPSSQNKHHSI